MSAGEIGLAWGCAHLGRIGCQVNGDLLGLFRFTCVDFCPDLITSCKAKNLLQRSRSPGVDFRAPRKPHVNAKTS